MEKPNPLTKETQPKAYSISFDQFLIPPSQLEPYNPGEKVTRNNFINFLIHSFAISRGFETIHVLFLKWLKIKTGFDYYATLSNLVHAGDWEILSESEKAQFKKSFGAIPQHSGASDPEQTFSRSIKKLLNMVASEDPDIYVYMSEKDKEMESLETYQDLLGYFKRLREGGDKH